ncbi:glycosyltransferase [Marinobacter caseinilyticus]|uniref:glycosyltransferase n=1 Tax=Marinobacter caseinilyticus TaxID=2692195 RepID=UPI00140DF4D2|nr:glycosyltransferase [Marinobacter caseinilyticus]
MLFIAYFYPPTESTGVPGSMRTVKFVRNLSNGECHVMTSAHSIPERDNALNHLSIPINGEHVHRVASWDIFKLLLFVRQKLRNFFQQGSNGAKNSGTSKPVFKHTQSEHGSVKSGFQRLKDFIYNLCYFPDQAGPWIIPAVLAGRRIVRKHNMDIIFATGSPWSGLITGYLISKLTGKPFIADFRDPWMNNPFHQSKGALLDRWGASLERKVVQHASAVSLNTPPLMEEFLTRYPQLKSDKFFIMPNGFDPADFDNLKPEPRLNDENTLLLCHAGFLYGVRDPEVLLEAIKAANQRLSGSGKRVVFRQIGDVQLNYDIHERYADLIHDRSLIIDAPRPYQECLSALAAADAVVNVQPATQSQIPSKLYDYLGINRPIINITSRDGALGQLVTDKQLGILVGFDEVAALTDILVGEADAKANRTFSGYESRDEFNIRSISGILADKLVRYSI